MGVVVRGGSFEAVEMAAQHLTYGQSVGNWSRQSTKKRVIGN